MVNRKQHDTYTLGATAWDMAADWGSGRDSNASGLSADATPPFDTGTSAAAWPGNAISGVSSADILSLTGSSTLLDVAGSLDGGHGGITNLLIQDGATVVVDGNLNVGNVAGASGTVDIENATLIVNGALTMGEGGTGTLIVGTGAEVCFGDGLIVGPGGDILQYAAIDPPFLDGGPINTITESIEQDYNAYVDGTASFVINNGYSFTLATPKITGGAVTFQIGSTTASNAADSTLVLNAGTVIGPDTIKFENAHATLIIGTDTLATIDIQATDSASSTLVANPNLNVPLIGHFGGTLTNFQKGNTIVVDTTVAAKFVEATVTSPVVDVEAINGGAVLGTLTFSSSASANVAVSNTTYLVDVLVSPLCFVAGARIATPAGEVPVEHLTPGDTVTTFGGQARTVAWVGEGRVLATQGQRSAATPVIVRKGALADNVPNKDLYITKAHGLFIDGVLIPVEFLVNHRSILWDDRAREVRLFHVELDTHDVLLANGAPAESYRDDGNRWLFQNANSGWHLPPREPFAEVHTGGPVVDAVWTRLLRRSGPRAPMPLTSDPGLHLLVNGRRLDSVSRAGEDLVFSVDRPPDDVRIISRAGSPQELGLARDPRCLGVALRRIVLRQGTRVRVVAADDAALSNGFYAYEADNGFRWTDGEAVIPPDLFGGFAPPMEIVLTVASSAHYMEDGVRQEVA